MDYVNKVLTLLGSRDEAPPTTEDVHADPVTLAEAEPVPTALGAVPGVPRDAIPRRRMTKHLSMHVLSESLRDDANFNLPTVAGSARATPPSPPGPAPRRGDRSAGKNKLADRMLELLCAEREYVQLHRDTTVSSLTVQPVIEHGQLHYEVLNFMLFP